MTILIRQARVISPGSSHHQKVVDILIESGVISEIRKNIQAKGSMKVIEADGLMVSMGWTDLQCALSDPGYEYREDISTLIRAAASGGFTRICVHSHSKPPLHNKTQIEYVLSRSENRVVDVLPMGTVTVDAKGKDLAEMYDMQQSGAVGFSDHKHPISDSGMVIRALQYAAGINSFVVTHCDDESISHGGHMNEGEVSTALGLKGIPALAEEVMLRRNLELLGYAGGRLHIPTITSKASVDMIRSAKAAGLQVTCGVSAAHLLLDDSVLTDFDTNYKVNPPFRTRRDVQALRHAVENGVIDVIVSDHLPLDVECKDLEFDLADFGMIGLQTAFACALEGMGRKNIESVVRAFTEGAAAVLGMNPGSIAEGEQANLTLFTAEEVTELTEKNNESRSLNSPFFSKPLQGRVVGVINGSRTHFN